jgi:mannose-6-phosphate isomerase-like protein (cupin superfamily)
MKGRGHAVISLDALGRYPAMGGAPVLMPFRRELGVRSFGMNCWTAPVGAPVIERHSEPDGDEEVYLVVRGAARFTVGEEQFDVGPSTAVYVPPDTLREAVAMEPDTLVLTVGAKPGEVFEPKSWEDFQIAFAEARRRGEHDARALLAAEIARDPERWQARYNAASFEALAGKADAAFAHLEHALALGPPRVRQLAATSADLAALHSDRRWQQLVAQG